MIIKTYGNGGWRKAASLAVLSLVLASCGAGKTAVPGRQATKGSKTAGSSKTSQITTALPDEIVRYGRKYLGKPYRYAARGPEAFDCSGYTSFVFRKFGYRLEPSTAGQSRQTVAITRKGGLRKGDLVFFEGRRRNGKIGHVGIVTEAFPGGHFKFIHSSTSRGVIISSSSEPYFAPRYLRGGRVLNGKASYADPENPPSAGKKHPAPRALAAGRDAARPDIPKKIPGKATKFITIAGQPGSRPETGRKSAQPDIPEMIPDKATKHVTIAGQPDSRPENGHDPVIIVQTDPLKNPPLDPTGSTANGRERADETLRQAKSGMILRDDENTTVPPPPRSHTVRAGETLYSISRQYGCSLEQLREWNPQTNAGLKAGEKLLLYIP
ncbi:MAG: C40 family peptidase [Proteiniphilum sp.]|jgi:cell wall-associated NlpC family hydrolase/LysM repeat protein|nr:C40 family peptidase [Proteiniphilum sp.]